MTEIRDHFQTISSTISVANGKELKLKGTKVTAAAMEKLEASLPNCRIER